MTTSNVIEFPKRQPKEEPTLPDMGSPEDLEILLRAVSAKLTKTTMRTIRDLDIPLDNSHERIKDMLIIAEAVLAFLQRIWGMEHPLHAVADKNVHFDPKTGDYNVKFEAETPK